MNISYIYFTLKPEALYTYMHIHIYMYYYFTLKSRSKTILPPTEQSRMFDLVSFFMRRKLPLLKNHYVLGTVLSAFHMLYLLFNWEQP